MKWQTVSTAFMKGDKPFGPGDFRINGERVLSMKLAEAELHFKPNGEGFTEPWMYDARERLNRRSIRFLVGGLTGPVKRTFEEKGEDADWWVSQDGKTLYITTAMTNHTVATKGDEPAVWTHKLFKSTDGGLTWMRLAWPEERNISSLRFLDTQRGYAEGWGPALYRTTDGGNTWTSIPVPKHLLGNKRDYRTAQIHFDRVSLGEDHILRLALWVPHLRATQIYSLPFESSELKLEVELPDRKATHFLPFSGGKLALLTLRQVWVPNPAKPQHMNNPNVEAGHFEDVPGNAFEIWDGKVVREIHHFEKRLQTMALYRTPGGRLMIDAIRNETNDEVLLSSDGGLHWISEPEGSSAQGGYYDTKTGIRWRVSGYTLSKREIR